MLQKTANKNAEQLLGNCKNSCLTAKETCQETGEKTYKTLLTKLDFRANPQTRKVQKNGYKTENLQKTTKMHNIC